MGFIYKITNNINGKIYIGKTEKTIEQRFEEHKREALKNSLTYNSKLYPAINKYGIENFSISIIEEVQKDDDINEREKYYINQFNSLDDSIGYNISPGGLGGPLFKGHKHSDESRLKMSQNNVWRHNKQPQWFIDKRMYNRRHRTKNKVQCLDDGIIYNSKEELNATFNGDCSYALINNTRFRGKFYIELPEDKQEGYTEQERTFILNSFNSRLQRIKKESSSKAQQTIRNKSIAEKQKIQEKKLNSINSKCKEEKELIKQKQSLSAKRNYENKSIEEKQEFSNRSSSFMKNLWQNMSEQERLERNKKNSLGQKGKKRYKNLITGKHKMFYPESVPEGWELIKR